jgi:ribosomal protein S6
MTLYEAMLIIPDRFQEDELDGVLKGARAEIEALGGEVVSSIRLGRRQFARELDKSDHGHYAVINFSMGSEHIPALHVKYKLSDDILRVQIVRSRPAPAVVATTAD